MEKNKNPSTQRMGFYISRHLPSNNVYRLQIIFIEDIFVQILHVFRSGTYVNPFFILTGEWDRTAFFWMQLPGRETDTKRANYLFIVHNQFSGGSLTKAHFLATSQSSELLGPLLQHTEPKLLYSRPTACTSEPSSHLSAGILTSYNREAWPLWSWSLHKGADQSRRQATVLQEKQEPIQQFFALSFILEGSQEIKPRKQKASLGHIRNPSTSMGFQWKRCIETSHPIKAEDL